MKYIGIDHHKQYFIATMMNEEGKVISKDRVSTDRMAIRDYIKRVNREGQLKAVIEACYEWNIRTVPDITILKERRFKC